MFPFRGKCLELMEDQLKKWQGRENRGRTVKKTMLDAYNKQTNFVE